MASVRVVEITRQHLEGLSAPPSNTATITRVKPISSYNWIEAATPTIAVPGSPALWAPPPGPQMLKKDTGLVYIAQNAARHPDYPLEPLFRAVQITEPTFDFKAVDIVTDRNNLRKLLSFVNPKLGTNSQEPFTISIEMTGNTAIFCRQETKVQEFIGEHEFRGFGHEFEKAYTKNRVAGSTGHHRVIAYRFGGLKFVVRYETDGYVGTDATASPSRSSKSEEQANSLSSMLANLSLSPASSPSSIQPAGSKLTVRQQGDIVPLGSMLEIKTRISHKPLAIQDVAPQLWISQTPKLVRAYHQKGIFQKPEVEDVTKAIAVWEQNNSRDLVRLAALLRRILGIAKELGGSVIVRYENASKKLVISTVTRKRSLPEDLYSLWTEVDTPKVISTSVSQAVEAGLVVGENPAPSLGVSIASGKSVPERQRVDIPFFDTITYCEQQGFRHFFRRIHPHLAEYRILCQSLDHLAIEGLKQRRLQDVIAELKTGDDDYDPEERRVIRGSKRKARDAAFALVYLFLMGDLESTPQDSNAAYNAVQYIVSHYRKFKPKTRKMVREAYEAKVVMTLKQRQGLDKWPVTERGQDSEESTVAEDDSPFAWSSDESL